MKRPAVFFDRDNTLIATDGYLGEPAGVALIDGAADAVARVRALGFAAIVFSNQSGVARGMFTEEAVHAVNARMDEMLLDQNSAAVIDRHEFCPFHPEATVEHYRQDSDLRKPRPGMILQAAEKLALDLSRSWAVGDAPRDIEAGNAAGCRTILIKDLSLTPSTAAHEANRVEPDFTVVSLKEAIAVIEGNPMPSGELQAAMPAPAEPAHPEEPAPAEAVPMAVVSDMPSASEEGAPSSNHVEHDPGHSSEAAHVAREQISAEVEAVEAANPPSNSAEYEKAVNEAADLKPSLASEAVDEATTMRETEREKRGSASEESQSHRTTSTGPAPAVLRPKAEALRRALLASQASAAGQAPSAHVASSHAPTATPQMEPVLAERAPLADKSDGTARLEAISLQIFEELRRHREQPYTEFSVSKMLAGVVQVISLAAIFFAYLHRDQPELQPLLLLALYLQALTIALLIMGRQR